MPWSDDIARRLRQVRTALGLSQAEFAERLGLRAHQVGDMERNRTMPSAFLIGAVVAAFKTDPRWLLLGEGTPPPGAGKEVGIEEPGAEEAVNVEEHLWFSCKACGGRLPGGYLPDTMTDECPHCRTSLRWPPGARARIL